MGAFIVDFRGVCILGLVLCCFGFWVVGCRLLLGAGGE